ncbi:MAG: hypothetical protein PSV16_00695 [Flavobacterium sp.]|nr:hypothetical protein [Flavobacterium sp.]
MTDTLNGSDIQKIITGLEEKLPADQKLISASMTTDKNGLNKFVFTMDGLGSVTLSADANGIYNLESLEGEHQNIVCITFHGLVSKFADKVWAT